MKSSQTLLVTGGAGYIGSVLISKLVEKNHKVRVLDSLIYGSSGIAKYISKNSIEFIKADIRDKGIFPNILKDVDSVIHLAAIVGEPLCKKIPKAAKQINELVTKNLIDNCKRSSVKRFIFASTCSNYGSSKKIVDENTPVQSLSLYSETKVKSESIVLASKDKSFEPCVLRFATAYGLSPRMRFDLLVQEFIRDAIIDKKISIFGPNFWRPLVHVDDIANACLKIIESSRDLTSGEIYNVGSNEQNFTKLELAEMIKAQIPSKIEILEKKNDLRNYCVSFDKIKKNLNFCITKTVSDGISEILKEVKNGRLDPRESEFSNMSKLTEKVRIY